MPDLAQLPTGASVFVDTNIFDLHFQSRSLTCMNFFSRVVNNEIDAYVNIQVLSDLLHKLMTADALSTHCIRERKVGLLKNYLKDCKLRGIPIPFSNYQTQFENVLEMGLKVLPIDEKLLVETKTERTTYYLMTGDSLHIGCMTRRVVNRQKAPLSDIVTFDGDFTSIPGLTVWKPSDVIDR
jgi:predicted nucleic acid-binding protein